MDNQSVAIGVSSIYSYPDYDKSNIVDNLPSAYPLDCSCCFATKYENRNGWLQLDLKEKYLVYQINVVRRSDGKSWKRLNVMMSMQ